MQRRKRGADGDGAVALFPSDADRVLAGGRIKAALFLRAFVNGQATGWMGMLVGVCPGRRLGHRSVWGRRPSHLAGLSRPCHSSFIRSLTRL